MGLLVTVICAAGFFILVALMLIQMLRPLDPQVQDLILTLFETEDEWVYGLQLRNRSGGRLGWDIYTYLRAMESGYGAEQLLEGREGLTRFYNRGYRPRYYYQLTEAGRTRRKALLEARAAGEISRGG